MLKLNTAAIPGKNWIVFLIGWLGIIVGTTGISLADNPSWIKFFDNLHWTSGTLSAALLAWLGYCQSASPQIAQTRRWFALGFGSYAVGQLIWDIQILQGYSQFPSPSDFFYLWLGPCLILGLIDEIRAHQQRSTYKIIFMDTLSLSTAALTLVLVLYLPQRGALDYLSLLVLIAYPVSLLVVTGTALMMIPSLRLRLSPSLLLFVAASIVTACSWMKWNLHALEGTTIDGEPFNVSFSIAVLMAGFSITFWQIEISQQAGWDRLCDGFLRLLPLLNVVLACAAVVAVSANHVELHAEQGLTIAGALVVILLAIVRQGILLKDREQLLLTQSLLRTVIDTVPLRVFWKDRESRYLGCNAAFAQDAGQLNSGALIGKDDYQLSWREQAELYQADDRSVMTARQGKLNYEEPQNTPEGQTIWIRTSKVPLLDSAGEVSGVLGVYDDITVLKEYQDKLKLMSGVFENTLESIMITNAGHELIEVNDAFTKVTGYTREEVLGKNPRILKSGYHSDEFYQSMWQAINITGHWSGERWNRKKNGEVYPEWITISAITDDTGAVSHYVGISSDITLLKQHEKQLEHVAHYDALTGIPNRLLLADRMKQAIAQTKRDQKLLAVCYLDLDGFKPVNDNHGHHIGDQVLIKLAERIAHTIREGDTLARLGGDEFVILLLGQEKMDECIHSVERLLENIAQPVPIENQAFVVTASIGVTIYPIDDQDPDTLLRHADHAMYKAKQSGKNQYFHYDAIADQHALSHRQFLDEISQGLTNNQFELFYQPKVDMADNKVIGVEALIRWNHPQQGLLSPALFLPAIENSKLEIKLGDWVIDRALTQIQQWRQLGHNIQVSVNIAGQQLLDSDFVDKLTAAFANYPTVPHHLIELEILETTALEIDHSSSVIKAACLQLGVTFALDDFGTGYSTLTYLKQLPVSTLKIDQSFVRDMLEDSGDRAIVEGIIALAKVFGRKTVAEGVETDRHFSILKGMGCQVAQGYGIAKPMPEKEFFKWYLAGLSE
jgi:diguanylate cyclase (GGDEF)-like protein/PAS domain S-box-containing protein